MCGFLRRSAVNEKGDITWPCHVTLFSTNRKAVFWNIGQSETNTFMQVTKCRSYCALYTTVHALHVLFLNSYCNCSFQFPYHFSSFKLPFFTTPTSIALAVCTYSTPSPNSHFEYPPKWEHSLNSCDPGSGAQNQDHINYSYWIKVLTWELGTGAQWQSLGNMGIPFIVKMIFIVKMLPIAILKV